jgi:hypothetical protein
MHRKTITFGGRGGTPFRARIPKSVGIQASTGVHAIRINGDKFGGPGGAVPAEEILDPDDYWAELDIRSGNIIDYLSLRSKDGRTVSGGSTTSGTPASYRSIRIISISGSAYEWLDSLTFEVVIDYKPSTLIERDAQVVMDIATSGQTFKQFNNQTTRTLHSFKLVSERMTSWGVNTSAEVEFEAVFKTTVDYKTSSTRTETLSDEIETTIATGTSTESVIATGEAAFLIGRVHIMQDSDGHPWMAPVSEADWVVLARDQFSNLVGRYDITGGTELQTGLASETLNGFSKLRAPN